MMKHFIAFCLLFVAKQISAERQLVALPESRTVDVILNAESFTTGSWNCGEQVTLRRINAVNTNATLTTSGTFTCTFRRSLDGAEDVSKITTIRVAEYDELPLHLLATSYIQQLFVKKFEYLALSHHFLSSNYYLPNIAKFFKNSMDKTSQTLDQVITYLQAKHITTAQFDGSNPPDYTRALMNDGFTATVGIHPEPVDNVTSAFEKAFNIEVETIQLLTWIGYLAEEEDTEVEEFVNADLIPPVKEYMKTLMDYRKTVKAITVEYPRLGEYLFDREMS